MNCVRRWRPGWWMSLSKSSVPRPPYDSHPPTFLPASFTLQSVLTRKKYWKSPVWFVTILNISYCLVIRPISISELEISKFSCNLPIIRRVTNLNTYCCSAPPYIQNTSLVQLHRWGSILAQHTCDTAGLLALYIWRVHFFLRYIDFFCH